MKIKKEIWVERCDFCENNKDDVCSICGKDICSKHRLSLSRGRSLTEKKDHMGVYIVDWGISIASCFCPDHLGLELSQRYTKSLEDK